MIPWVIVSRDSLSRRARDGVRRGASEKWEFVRSMEWLKFRVDQPIPTYDTFAGLECAVAVTRGNLAKWRTFAPVMPSRCS